MHITLAQHHDTPESESGDDRRAIDEIKTAMKRAVQRWLVERRVCELYNAIVDRENQLERELDAAIEGSELARAERLDVELLVAKDQREALLALSRRATRVVAELAASRKAAWLVASSRGRGASRLGCIRARVQTGARPRQRKARSTMTIKATGDPDGDGEPPIPRLIETRSASIGGAA